MLFFKERKNKQRVLWSQYSDLTCSSSLFKERKNHNTHTKGWMLSSQQHSNLTCTCCSSRKEENPTQLNPTQQTHKVQSCRDLIHTIRSHKLSLLEETPKKKIPTHKEPNK